jgi:hypothetical protein
MSVTDDLREFFAAVERHIANPSDRPADTLPLIDSIRRKVTDPFVSDSDRMKLAELATKLKALSDNTASNFTPPGQGTI